MTGPTVPYAVAEAILARMFGADGDVQRRTFRARLKTLKKLGIPLGVQPGRGRRASYGNEHLYQWAFCLELSEIGIDPTVIAHIVKRDWATKIARAFATAEMRGGDRIYFLAHPTLMSRSWGAPMLAWRLVGEAEQDEAIASVFGSRRDEGRPRRAIVVDLRGIVDLVRWHKRTLMEAADAPTR